MINAKEAKSASLSNGKVTLLKRSEGSEGRATLTHPSPLPLVPGPNSFQAEGLGNFREAGIRDEAKEILGWTARVGVGFGVEGTLAFVLSEMGAVGGFEPRNTQ